MSASGKRTCGLFSRRIAAGAAAALLAAATHGAASRANGPAPLVDLDFDGPAAAGAAPPTYHTQFAQPDFTPGMAGRAWRSDGFSSWVSLPLVPAPRSGLTVEAWVALASFPSDREVPTRELIPASLIQQATADTGFDLFVDTFGQWGFRISTDAGSKRIAAPQPFPLDRWVHVAATFDPAAGVARLYLDGRPVGQTDTGAGHALRPAATDLLIGRSWRDAELGIFRVNGINGAFDDVRLLDRALLPDAIARDAARPTPASATAALAVPAGRFAQDLQRPAYHAMPPANWTNEPHGLIRRGDAWHLFYQRTPNGPYKTEMHWGHMASRDLVDWTWLPDALWPTLQTPDFGFDQKGIWSGDVVTGPRGIAYAFYTSVNHSNLFNPGISVALSADPDLRRWVKRGPVIDAQGLRDLRDPYVWQQDGEWRMIVGAAMPGRGGGVAYYRCADLDDIKCWKKQPRIAPFEKMDIGADIWEMPMLEAIGGGKYILEANPIGGAVSKYGDPSTRPVYWIGRWDGRQFVPDDLRPRMLDLIPGHLSPTVARDQAGELVGIGIVDERRSTQAQKDAGWAHVFSLPRVWRLLPDGRTLGQSPWPGLAALRDGSRTIDQSLAGATGERLIGDLGRCAEYQVDFGGHPPGGPYGVYLAASPDGAEVTRLTYDPATGRMTLDKSRSTRSTDGEGPAVLTGSYDVGAFGVPRSLHIFVDHSVVDVFINDAAAFSVRLYPGRADSTRFGIIAGPSPIDITAKGWAIRPARFASDLAP